MSYDLPDYPIILPSPIAENGDKLAIEESSTDAFNYASGFPSIFSVPISAGGIAPKRESFNEAFYTLSSLTYYQQCGAPIIWQESLSYPVNAKVFTSGEDGKEYLCIQANGAGVENVGAKAPADNPDYWKLYQEEVEVFPTGTRMLFQQESAPTGWVKDTSTTYDDSALRIVTGTPTTGGSIDFSTAFASKSVSVAGSVSSTTAGGSVGSTTISTSTMPSHSHSITSSNSGTSGSYSAWGRGSYDSSYLYGSESTGSGGSHNHSFTGSSHTHTFTGTTATVNLAVKYVDFIICTKS